ncbi:MAG: hypothetical protein M1818_001772 [Claussenomyces sp. TS43310]|nr:MAG: hypothetical protein M1818_001772 [Claussenomyces sp. TS43310]
MANSTTGTRLQDKIAIVTGKSPAQRHPPVPPTPSHQTQKSSTPNLSSHLFPLLTLLTGGCSGYGQGIAIRFASEGAQVIIADLDATGGEQLASRVPNLHFLRANVALAEDWTALMHFAMTRFGRVDILVNNAGASYVNKPTLEVTEADFDKCFSVNVKSVFYSVPAFISPLLAAKSPGVMLNISSTGASRPRPGLVWYNASKAAVSNATKALAAEYGAHGIRVNALCPLLGATGLFETFTGLPNTEENQKAFLGNVPMGRLCTPSDVAGAALFLCSEEASFITGTTLEVDGGKCV